MFEIKKVGAEIEFSSSEETLLGKFLALYNAKRRFSVNRLYKENEIIYEYRCPVIRAAHYRNFVKFYYMISLLSNADYVEGGSDRAAGSMHTHLEIWKDGEKINSTEQLPDIYIESIINDLGDAMGRFKYPERNAIEDLASWDTDYTLRDMPYDSKSYAITFNTGHNTVEVRANETIPVWYVLFDKYLNGDRMLMLSSYEDNAANKYEAALYRYLRANEREYGLNDFARFIENELPEIPELWYKQIDEFYDYISEANYQCRERGWDFRIYSEDIEAIKSKIIIKKRRLI